MQINLNEKILIAANRLLRLRHVSHFEADYAPLIKSVKDVLVEIEAHLTKRAADSLKAGGKSAKRKVVKAKVTRPAKSG